MTTELPGLRERPRIISASHPGAVELASDTLRRGGVVALPTDTVYGLAAAIDQPRAIANLFAIKKRPDRKPIPILVSCLADLNHLSPGHSTIELDLAERFWPGALTLVLNAAPNLSESLTSTEVGGQRTVAVRLPAHPLAIAIIQAAGGALAVTSANHSDEQPALNASQVSRLISPHPDLILDGGPVSGGSASTIVRIRASQLEILRHGPITVSELTEFMRDVHCQGSSIRVGAV